MGAQEAAERISREMGKGNSAQRKWGTLDFDDVREVLGAYRALLAIYEGKVTDEQRELLGADVIVENPNGSATWRGRGIAIAAHPSIIIEEEGGRRMTLPLAWARAHGVHHHHWMLGQSTPCACGVRPPWGVQPPTSARSIVHSVTELDALPVGSLILTEQGGTWGQTGRDRFSSLWYEPGHAGLGARPQDLSLPALVLYSPEEA